MYVLKNKNTKYIIPYLVLICKGFFEKIHTYNNMRNKADNSAKNYPLI